MRKELSHVELIENYLLGRLNLDERRAFELKMNGDPGLKNEVQLQKNLTDRLQFLAFKTEMIASHGVLSELYKPWWKKGIYLNSFLAMLTLIIVATIFMLSGENQIEEKVTSDPVKQQDIIQNTPSIAPINFVVDTVVKPAEFVAKIPPTKRDLIEPPILFPGFIKQFSSETINAELGGTIETKDSKSHIHFPSGMFASKNGDAIIGEVEIRYREYRNAAEMAFSGIPMVYEEDDLKYNFNSAGMIEVRAFQNGEELTVKPGSEFTIDYNVTEQLDSCFFFALDDENKTWKKKEKIDFEQNSARTLNSDEPVFVGDDNSPDFTGRGILGGIIYDSINPRSWGGSIALYNQMNYNEFAKPVYGTEGDLSMYQIDDIIPGTYIAEIVFQVDDDEKTRSENITVDNINVYDDKVTMLNIYPSWYFDSEIINPSRVKLKSDKANASGKVKRKKRRRVGNGSYQSTYELKDSVMNIPKGRIIGGKFLLADTMRFQGMGISPNLGAGKTVFSPNLVQGLNCPAFGVYNCDQIKHIKDQVAVRATYKNDKGELIIDGYNLSMINFNLNASFGFIPNQFTCEWRAETILLLFTSQNKLYTISAEKFEEMNIVSDGHYTFEMTDITDQVKSSDDLKTYLGL